MKSTTLLLALALVLCSYFTTTAQEGQQEIGLRIGQSPGFMYKKYVNDESAFVGLLTFRAKGVQATVMGEFHYPMFSRYNDNFTWYWGIGTHLGFRQSEECRNIYDEDGDIEFIDCNYKKTRLDFGVDASIGMNYRIDQIPLMIGLEYKPYINILEKGAVTGHFGDFALTVTYVLFR